jgi:hypothetical protein
MGKVIMRGILLLLSAVSIDERAFSANRDVVVGRILNKVHTNIVPDRGLNEIYWGDVISTSADGSAKLQLYPSLVFNLEKDTAIKVTGNLISKADGGRRFGEIAVEILRGKAAGRLYKGSDFSSKATILAPRSVSSIRGTTFLIDVTDDSTLVGVEEGVVEVENLATGKNSFLVKQSGKKFSSRGEEAENTGFTSISRQSALASLEEITANWNGDATSVLTQQSSRLDELRDRLNTEVAGAIARLRAESVKVQKRHKTRDDRLLKKLRR